MALLDLKRWFHTSCVRLLSPESVSSLIGVERWDTDPSSSRSSSESSSDVLVMASSLGGGGALAAVFLWRIVSSLLLFLIQIQKQLGFFSNYFSLDWQLVSFSVYHWTCLWLGALVQHFIIRKKKQCVIRKLLINFSINTGCDICSHLKFYLWGWIKCLKGPYLAHRLGFGTCGIRLLKAKQWISTWH